MHHPSSFGRSRQAPENRLAEKGRESKSWLGRYDRLIVVDVVT